MGLFYPTINTFEENLKKMIQIFGIYLIYCFIEAARPVERDGKDDSIKSNRDKDKLASTWITDVFNPLGMYNCFLSIIENQPTDNEVKRMMERMMEKNVKNTGKDEFIIVNDRGRQVKGFPPSAANLFENRFYYITSKQARHDEVSKPLYELDKEKIRKLTYILKENYPIFYEALLEARAGLLGEPKRRSLQSQRNREPHYFDPSEDQ
jgi:hypothetical protein